MYACFKTLELRPELKENPCFLDEAWVAYLGTGRVKEHISLEGELIGTTCVDYPPDRYVNVSTLMSWGIFDPLSCQVLLSTRTAIHYRFRN